VFGQPAKTSPRTDSEHIRHTILENKRQAIVVSILRSNRKLISDFIKCHIGVVIGSVTIHLSLKLKTIKAYEVSKMGNNAFGNSVYSIIAHNSCFDLTGKETVNI
jgi:hypothetical protein